MNSNQAAAYVQSQVACAMIECVAMLIANYEAEARGNAPMPYKKGDFIDLIQKYGIGHNDVHQFLFRIDA